MASLNTQKMLGMQLLESAEGDPWPKPLFHYPQRSGSETLFHIRQRKTWLPDN